MPADALEALPNLVIEEADHLQPLSFQVRGAAGIVADPTTEGLGDSKRAMTYEKPWSDEGKSE